MSNKYYGGYPYGGGYGLDPYAGLYPLPAKPFTLKIDMGKIEESFLGELRKMAEPPAKPAEKFDGNKQLTADEVARMEREAYDAGRRSRAVLSLDYRANSSIPGELRSRYPVSETKERKITVSTCTEAVVRSGYVRLTVGSTTVSFAQSLLPALKALVGSTAQEMKFASLTAKPVKGALTGERIDIKRDCDALNLTSLTRRDIERLEELVKNPTETVID
jgi:hypothetical protein